MKNIIKLFGFILLGSVTTIGLIGYANANIESANDLISHNRTEITTYPQLVEHLKQGDEFLVKYYINRDYTEKTLKAEHQGLKSVSDNLYVHHFSNGELTNSGDVIFNGSKIWSMNNIIYEHTYKYEFMPNNQVKISGKDLTNSFYRTIQSGSYSLIGYLGKSVIINAYS